MSNNAILVGIDLNDHSDVVLETGVSYAKMLSAALCLVHVVPDTIDCWPMGKADYGSGDGVRDAAAEEYREEHRRLRELKAKAEAVGVEAMTLMVQGATAEKLAEEANKLNASLVVLGSHPHGAFYHWLAGSTLEEFLKINACPILVVPVPPRPDADD